MAKCGIVKGEVCTVTAIRKLDGNCHGKVRIVVSGRTVRATRWSASDMVSWQSVEFGRESGTVTAM